jgi:hypothetical protein
LWFLSTQSCPVRGSSAPSGGREGWCCHQAKRRRVGSPCGHGCSPRRSTTTTSIAAGRLPRKTPGPGGTPPLAAEAANVAAAEPTAVFLRLLAAALAGGRARLAGPRQDAADGIWNVCRQQHHLPRCSRVLQKCSLLHRCVAASWSWITPVLVGPCWTCCKRRRSARVLLQCSSRRGRAPPTMNAGTG